jgi:hypothetical protein
MDIMKTGKMVGEIFQDLEVNVYVSIPKDGRHEAESFVKSRSLCLDEFDSGWDISKHTGSHMVTHGSKYSPIYRCLESL